ncbi:hypothetical protein FJZ36_13990 [Candidatus Poribacteria bacterium]|nr:hypothetical protein [Candidatus Poribacteria bacterium]
MVTSKSLGRRGFLAGVLSVSVIAGCAGHRLSSGAESRYPWWFLETPEGPYAVGYSPAYHHEASSVASARHVAAAALAIEDSVSYEGGRGIERDVLGTFFAGNDTAEAFDDARARAYEKDGEAIAQSASDRLVFVLLARPSSARLSFDDETISFPVKPPAWTTSLPQDPTCLYAVGVSVAYYHEESSWEVAERNARLGLAQAARAVVRELHRRENAQQSGVSTVDVDVRLTGLRVVKRWRNPADGSCYTLARAMRP